MHDQLEDQLDGNSKTQIRSISVCNLSRNDWPTVSRLRTDREDLRRRYWQSVLNFEDQAKHLALSVWINTVVSGTARGRVAAARGAAFVRNLKGCEYVAEKVQQEWVDGDTMAALIDDGALDVMPRCSLTYCLWLQRMLVLL